MHDSCIIKDLLNEILKTPSTLVENKKKLEGLLQEDVYFEEYKGLLMENFHLAYMFLPKVGKSDIMLNSRNHASIQNFMHFLTTLDPPAQLNFYVVEGVDALSRRGLVGPGTVGMLVEKKRGDLLDGVFLKYRDSSRSNELYGEIKRNIEMMEGYLTSYLKNADRTLFSLLYSLLSQDIHPFFEDNLNLVFHACYTKYKENQVGVNSLFELFISKYPEFTDVKLILKTLCEHVVSGGSPMNPYQVNSIITKAFGYSNSSRPLVLSYLNAVLSRRSPLGLFDCTANLLGGNDERAIFKELILLVNPSPGEIEEKSFFYQLAVLKAPGAEEKAREKIFNFNPSAQLVVLDAFYYLLSIKHFLFPPASLFTTDLIFISCKMAVEYSNSCTLFYTNQILQVPPSPVHWPFPITDSFFSSILSCNRAYLDPFTSAFILCMIRENKLNERMKSETNKYLNALFMRIEHITDSNSVELLFDSFLLVGAEGLQEVLTYIMNNELVEVYHLLIYALGISIKDADKEIISTVLQQEAFYKERTLVLPMICLLISAYREKVVEKRQVVSINAFLNSRILAYFVEAGEEVEAETAELKFLLRNEYSDELEKSFLSKKYARLVIRKMKAMGMKEENLREVLKKNRKNVESEYTLTSITNHYDL